MKRRGPLGTLAVAPATAPVWVPAQRWRWSEEVMETAVVETAVVETAVVSMTMVGTAVVSAVRSSRF